MKPIKNNSGIVPPVSYKLNLKSNNWVYCPDPKDINPKTGRCTKQQVEIIVKKAKQQAVANVNSGDFKNALNNIEYATLKRMIKSGALPNNTRDIIKKVNKDFLRDFGESLLNSAARDNQFEILDFLLNNGLNLKTSGDSRPGLALIIAASKGYFNIVKLLAIKGQATNTMIKNAVDAADEYGNSNILNYLSSF